MYCIVKVVCEDCCPPFSKFIDEQYVIISSRSLPAIEHILIYYKEINTHLLRCYVDVHNMTRISDVYYNKQRKLTHAEEERVRNVSKRYFRAKQTLQRMS